MDQGIEIWKEINGFDGDYFVSNLGRIKSYKVSSNGKILKSNTNKLGYVYFSLTKNCVLRSFTIHRLVALAFIHNSENKPQVNHINGIKTDNTVENLEWATMSENMNHALNTGLKTAPKDFNHYNSRFKKEDIINIRESKLSESKLASVYLVNRATIGKIKRFERYKNI